MGLSSALAVAAIFGWSACLKLRDLPLFREQVADFRVVRYRLSRPLAIGVPVAELASAILLVVPPTRRLGALGALVLVCTFGYAMIRVMRSGRTTACACFGGASDLDTVGWPSLIRIAAVGCVSVVALGWSRSAAPSPVWTFLAAVGLAALIVLAGELTRLLTDLRRAHRRLLSSLLTSQEGSSE